MDNSLAPGTENGNFVRNSAYCGGVTTDPSGACGVNSMPISLQLIGLRQLFRNDRLGRSHIYLLRLHLVPYAQPTTETTLDTATPACTSALISWTASTTADNVIVVISTGAIGSTPTDGIAYTASATLW
jgi:hypothetical protein